jgi:hypothetical protein
MKARAFAAVLLLAGVCCTPWATSAADPSSYEQLVAKAESDGVGVDYTAMRLAYAAGGGNDPFGMALQDAVVPMLQAVNDGDCAKAVAESEKVLKVSFISMLPHLVRSECFNKQGELGRAAREDTIAHGLRDSIFESGDGLSQKTAFVVVTLDEERFVLSTRGLSETSQALIEGNGHSYDVIKAAAKDGSAAEVTFQIDALLAAETRAFAPKH